MNPFSVKNLVGELSGKTQSRLNANQVEVIKFYRELGVSFRMFCYFISKAKCETKYGLP